VVVSRRRFAGPKSPTAELVNATAEQIPHIAHNFRRTDSPSPRWRGKSARLCCADAEVRNLHLLGAGGSPIVPSLSRR